MTTIVIIILVFFSVSFIFFLKDRDKNLRLNVDNLGGMRNKYKYLIDTLLKEPGSKIIKEERDRIVIQYNRSLTKGEYIITESFDELEIIWLANVGRIGKENKTWSFKTSTPQEKIIKDIRNYHLSLM